MKCLVLLLAIAVCRGDILDTKRDYPKDVLRELNDQSIRGAYRPFEQLKKISTEENSIPAFNSPWKSFNQPKIIPQYINYRTSFPKTWINNDVFDYKNFQELIKFPGGDFLLEQIEKCLYEDPTECMYQDTRVGAQDASYVALSIDELLKKVPLYLNSVEDVDFVTMLITKDIVKYMLQERMMCPTTYMDKHLIKTVQAKLPLLLKDNQYQLVNVLTTWMSEMAIDQDAITKLTIAFTEDVQQKLDQDIKRYIVAVGFKDLAVQAHKMYREIKTFFDNWTTDPARMLDNLDSLIVEITTSHAACPGRMDFSNKMNAACWDFKDLFVQREGVEIYSRLRGILHSFMYNQFNVDHMHNMFNVDYRRTFGREFGFGNLEMTVQQYVRNIVHKLSVCEMTPCWNPETCFQKETTFGPKWVDRTMPNFWSKVRQVQTL